MDITRNIKILTLFFLILINIKSQSINTDSLKLVIDTTKIDSIKHKAYKEIIPYYFNTGKHNECIKYSKQYIKMLSDSSIIKSKIYSVIAKSYNALGLHSFAYDNINKAIIISSNLKDSLELINNFITLSGTYLNLNNFTEALKILNKTKKFADNYNQDKEKKDRLYQYIYSSLGGTYKNLGNIDSAKYYFYKTRKYLPKDNKNSFVINDINLAQIYNNEKDYKNALYYLKLALKDTNSTKEDIKYIIFADLSKVYLNLGEIDLAKKYINRTLQYAKKGKYYKMLMVSYEILKDISLKEKNCTKTEKYIDLFTNLYDSVKTSELKVATNYYESLLINQKKAQEIENLKKDNEIKRVKIIQERNKMIAVSVVLTLSLLIIVILVIQRKKLNSAYKNIVKESERNIALMEKYKALAKKLKLDAKSKEDEIEENKVINEAKYKSSSLDEKTKEAIMKKIYYLLEEKKIYKDQTLKLSDVAEMVGVNKTYISQVLTEKNKPFINLINHYRIEHAKLLLSDNKNNNLTIEGIAEESGFRYTSTFNRAFKKHVGVTPSTYLKNLDNTN